MSGHGSVLYGESENEWNFEMKGLVALLTVLAGLHANGNSMDVSRSEKDRQPMRSDIRSVRGVWEFGEDHEIVVQLEADGRGALKFVLADYLFSWVADGGSVITCSIDPDFRHGRRRGVLPVDMRSFVLRHVPERNELELEPNGIFRRYFRGKRILRPTSGEPNVDELIRKDEECRRKKEKKLVEMEKAYWKKWSRITVTNRCENFEMLLSVLAEDVGGGARRIAVKTEVEELKDSFGCARQFGQALFTAELDVGYFEVGPRPTDLEFRVLLSEPRNPRPEELPPPSKVCKTGIKELVESWQEGGKKVKTVSLLRIDGRWKECRDRVVLNWRLGQERAVARAMKARFEGRFPCDVIVSTTRRKLDQDDAIRATACPE